MTTPTPTRQDRSLARRKAQNAFHRSLLFTALLPVTFLLGLAAGYLLWGRGGSEISGQAAAPVPTAVVQEDAAEAQQNVRRYDIPVDDDYVLGPDDAPITLVEFSDYECPFCRKWHEEVWPRLQEAFPGQIRLVYRDFPLANTHFNANSAAEAANCAGEQGQYYEFHSKLFSSDELSGAVYEQYATALKLDMPKFQDCMATDRTLAEVEADLEFASNLGITSTPTFFINGLAIVGAQSFDVFQEVIAKELAGEIP